MIEDIKNIKSTKKELREFGLTIGIILVILGSIALWRNKDIYPYFLGIGTTFIVLGLTFYKILLPLQKIWMGLSLVIGFFVSRIILSILYFLVITPIGLAMRLFKKDIIDQKINRNADSYWHKRNDQPKDKMSYENQY